MASRLSVYFSGKRAPAAAGRRGAPDAVSGRGNEDRRRSRAAGGGVAEGSSPWAALEVCPALRRGGWSLVRAKATMGDIYIT